MTKCILDDKKQIKVVAFNDGRSINRLFIKVFP